MSVCLRGQEGGRWAGERKEMESKRPGLMGIYEDFCFYMLLREKEWRWSRD